MTASIGPEIDGLEFVEHLGTGGYSDVYLYERRSPRMRVAVKILKDVRLSDTELAQFAAEAETMAQLADHPYIVQVFSTDTVDDRPYLMMKYYPPPNLGTRAAHERFSVADVLRTAVKIASAVETAHRVGILHRDIKPANILVSQYGEPGLTDFGIAGRAADADDADDIGVSIPWSAPEVLGGTSNGSAASDVYSLGATVWHLLVGRSPFEIAGGDNSPRALMARVLRNPPPSTGRADVPTSLDRLLQQTMAKDPALRPRSALELARALQGIEQEQRFSRTEIVVEGLADEGSRPRRPQAGGDQTRMRAPVRPSGVPRPVTPPRAAAPIRQDRGRGELSATAGRPAQPVPRTRAALPADAPSATVLRPAAPTPTDVDVPPLTPRRGLRVKYALAAAAAAVVAAVVVGVVLFTRGPHRAATEGDQPTGEATDQTALIAAPLAAPVVTASYDPKAGVVHFTWNAPTGATGASYVWWQQSSPATKVRTTDEHVDVPTARPAAVCIQVQAIPVDGGAASPPSSPVCGK